MREIKKTAYLLKKTPVCYSQKWDILVKFEWDSYRGTPFLKKDKPNQFTSDGTH